MVRWTRIGNRSSVALAAALLWPGGRAPADVPRPEEMPAHVVVSGRTSTAKDILVVRTGDDVPATFANNKLKNTRGFSWYVSRHYALKTDYPEKRARSYLTLLELAYPHYVELFGREPPGLRDGRMPVVYASSKDNLRKALLSEGIVWDFRGGGITFESGYNCAYVYPSGSLQYHQRYILLHEATHLFQMALAGTVYNTPEWYYEGLPDAVSHHVFDSRKKQLTVHVLDKPTTIDFFDEGLRSFQVKPLTAEEIFKNGQALRGQSFLLVQFFLLDPGRLQKLRIWRDEITAHSRYDRTRAEELMKDLFGPWREVNAAFEAWRKSLLNTFHYAEWGWEQEADTLWSYGFATGGKLSRTNVYLVPGDRPAYRPLRMDYPLQAPDPLAGPCRRGVEEPRVGCVIDFSRNPAHGRAGIGMGLIEGEKAGKGEPVDGFLRVLVDRESRLVVDGSALGLARRAFPLPDDFRRAGAAGGHRIGMNVRIARAALEVTLRAAGDAGRGAATFHASVELKPPQRERLMSRPLAVLARDGFHGVTPYFDDQRRPEPNLLTPAPANRWRNPGDKQLWMLFRAARHLGTKAPASLLALKRTMLDAAARDGQAQRNALAAFDREIADVLKDIHQCGAPRKAIGLATMDVGRAISLREPDGEK